MKVHLLLAIFLITIQLVIAKESNAQSTNYNKEKVKSKSGSVWMHEINYPPLTTKSGLRSQVYYLILYQDGTYEQQVF